MSFSIDSIHLLKCENPFVDDYYFTVYNQKKERAESGLDGDGSEDQVRVPIWRKHFTRTYF